MKLFVLQERNKETDKGIDVGPSPMCVLFFYFLLRPLLSALPPPRIIPLSLVLLHFYLSPCPSSCIVISISRISSMFSASRGQLWRKTNGACKQTVTGIDLIWSRWLMPLLVTLALIIRSQ